MNIFKYQYKVPGDLKFVNDDPICSFSWKTRSYILKINVLRVTTILRLGKNYNKVVDAMSNRMMALTAGGHHELLRYSRGRRFLDLTLLTRESKSSIIL